MLEIAVLQQSNQGVDSIPPQAKAFEYSFKFMLKNKIHKFTTWHQLYGQ